MSSSNASFCAWPGMHDGDYQTLADGGMQAATLDSNSSVFFEAAVTTELENPGVGDTDSLRSIADKTPYISGPLHVLGAGSRFFREGAKRAKTKLTGNKARELHERYTRGAANDQAHCDPTRDPDCNDGDALAPPAPPPNRKARRAAKARSRHIQKFEASERVSSSISNILPHPVTQLPLSSVSAMTFPIATAEPYRVSSQFESRDQRGGGRKGRRTGKLGYSNPGRSGHPSRERRTGYDEAPPPEMVPKKPRHIKSDDVLKPPDNRIEHRPIRRPRRKDDDDLKRNVLDLADDVAAASGLTAFAYWSAKTLYWSSIGARALASALFPVVMLDPSKTGIDPNHQA